MKLILFYFLACWLPIIRHNISQSKPETKHIAVPTSYAVFNFDTTAAGNLSDSMFLTMAYNQNAFEIKAAKLAHKQSGDAKVRATAIMIKKDHDALDGNMQQLLIKKGYILPAPTAEQQGKFKYLNNWMGKDFNTRYADGIAADATGDIAFYNHFLHSTKDAELKTFACNAITILQADKTDMDSLIVHINKVPKSSW